MKDDKPTDATPELARAAQTEQGYSENSGTPTIPYTVRRAIKLLYIALIAGALMILVTFLWDVQRGKAQEIFKTTGVIGIILGYLFYWFLIDWIARGRNWARILFLVLTLFNILFFLVTFQHQFQSDPLQELMGLSVLGTNLVALILLFQRTSSDWYKR